MEKSALFRDLWSSPAVVAHSEHAFTQIKPDLAGITLSISSYLIESSPDQRLLVFAPADSISEERMGEVVSGRYERRGVTKVTKEFTPLAGMGETTSTEDTRH